MHHVLTNSICSSNIHTSNIDITIEQNLGRQNGHFRGPQDCLKMTQEEYRNETADPKLLKSRLDNVVANLAIPCTDIADPNLPAARNDNVLPI